MRRSNQYALDDFRRALFLQGSHQCLTGAQFCKHRQSIERRVGPKTVRHRSQGFLLFGGECAQTVLDAQAQLRQHRIRQVARRLGDEVHANPFGTDQPHHLLQTLLQGFWRIGEQQVRFIEKQRQQRFVGIAAFRQLFEQLCQQP